jgi:hypothetical protein
MANLTPNPEKTVLKSSAFQIRLKFLCDVGWKIFILAGQLGLELGPVLMDNLVKQGRLGPVAYVDSS